MGVESFEVIPDAAHKFAAQHTVHDAVVIGHRDEHHLADGDNIPGRGFEHHGFFLDFACSEDSRLRLVDDGRAHGTTEDTHIGEGKSPALNFIGAEIIFAGASSQIINRLGQAHQVKRIRVADDGYDEVAAGQGGSHAEVNGFMADDVRALDRDIDHREVLQSFGYGL